MRKPLLIICFIFVLLFSFLPIPLNGEDGIYNTFSGFIWCSQPNACIHEAGHKIDHSGGWVSSSPEYQRTIEEMGLSILDDPRENYAALFAFAQGKKENMPEQLHKFYDFELSERLLNWHIQPQ